MAEKKYVGKGWKNKQFDMINIQIKKTDLENITVDNYGNIKLVVAAMKKIDEKTKATHTIYVDDFVPQKQQSQQPQQKQNNQQYQQEQDLPF